jgi:hypothetical protein
MIWNFDAFHLPVQKDGDGGDTAQRVGTYYFGIKIRKDLGFLNSEYAFHNSQDFNKALGHLEKQPGIFVRHPIQWNEVSDFSRDQQTPLVIAMGMYGEQRPRLKRLFRSHASRFFRYQNKDVASPEHIGFYIRSLRIWMAYPLLVFSDLFMLLNSFILILKGLDKNNVGDDINHTLAVLQARLMMPTPVSWLARMLYKLRPNNFGNTKLGETNSIQGAWSWYFRPETGASSFHELYRPIIKKYF